MGTKAEIATVDAAVAAVITPLSDLLLVVVAILTLIVVRPGLFQQILKCGRPRTTNPHSNQRRVICFGTPTPEHRGPTSRYRFKGREMLSESIQQSGPTRSTAIACNRPMTNTLLVVSRSFTNPFVIRQDTDLKSA